MDTWFVVSTNKVGGTNPHLFGSATKNEATDFIEHCHTNEWSESKRARWLCQVTKVPSYNDVEMNENSWFVIKTTYPSAGSVFLNLYGPWVNTKDAMNFIEQSTGGSIVGKGIEIYWLSLATKIPPLVTVSWFEEHEI